MNKKDKMRIVIKFLKKNYNTDFHTKNKFRILISTILSQRTRDENTAVASERLFSKARTTKAILALPDNELKKLIRPSGTYRQKAKHIKAVCRILTEKYKGRVPKTRDELLSLPGVGYKTADIVLSYGYGIPTIAVDTHVNRIPKRIGLVNERADLEEVRKELERLVSRDRFVVNHGLVQFGRGICKPISPRCKICPIAKICNYSKYI